MGNLISLGNPVLLPWVGWHNRRSVEIFAFPSRRSFSHQISQFSPVHTYLRCAKYKLTTNFFLLFHSWTIQSFTPGYWKKHESLSRELRTEKHKRTPSTKIISTGSPTNVLQEFSKSNEQHWKLDLKVWDHSLSSECVRSSCTLWKPWHIAKMVGTWNMQGERTVFILVVTLVQKTTLSSAGKSL